MPSSVRFGSLPRRATILWYSSAVRPCCSMTFGSIMVPSNRSRDGRLACRLQRMQNGFENDAAVFSTEQPFDRALRVRHHADDVSFLVADARDRVNRSVRVPRLVQLTFRIAVAQNDLPVRLQLGELIVGRVVVAFTVADRDAKHLTLSRPARERGVRRLDTQMDVL